MLEAHAPGLGRHIRAVSTLHPERIRENIATRFGTEVVVTADPYAVIKNPEVHVVFICTPDFLHEEQALAAIDHGKAVYLEKPMATTVQGCDRIIQRAAERNVKVYVGHNMRFFPVFEKMKELLLCGRIGKVQAIWCRHFVGIGGDAYFKDWHSLRRNTHGLLLQKGAHDIDVIHWLAGAYTRQVVGMGKLSVYDQLPRRSPESTPPPVKLDPANWPPEAMSGFSPEIDVEDHSMLLMQLENGVQASYMQCHYTPDNHRNYTVIGTAGRMENHGCVSTPEHWASVHIWDHRTGYSEHGHEVHRIPDLEGGHGGADPRVIEDFFNYLEGGSRAGIAIEAARMAIATGYYGTESLRNDSTPYLIAP